MKKDSNSILGDIVFALTLASPWISFYLATVVGEFNIFGIAGVVRYSWIMLLFIIVPVLSILIGIRFKKMGKNCKKNFVIAYICIPILIIFGSYRFIFREVTSYDTSIVAVVENKTRLKMPDQVKVATLKDTYNTSYVKITSDECKKTFENEIKKDSRWTKELSIEIKSRLPFDMSYETSLFDYYAFYNVTRNEYNRITIGDDDDCIFIEYNCNLRKLVILSDYKISYSYR